MKITVVGAGYVGLVTAACLAELGNKVICVDRDHGRVALLQAGGVPIYEPGLDDWVQRNQHAGRLRFSTALPAAVAHAEVIFIAVGTPPQEDGSADLQHVLAVAQQIGRHMEGFKVVVNKSTVPVGTAQRTEQALREHGGQAFAVVSNPEFLKEGAAIDDFMHPDRIVIGLPEGPAGERARLLMARLYVPVIFDGRNLFDLAQMQELGFVYQGIGRRNRAARPVPVPRASHGPLLAKAVQPRPTSRLQP